LADQDHRRVPIGSIGVGPAREKTTVRLAGRVLAVDRRRLVLTDASGALELELDEGVSPPVAGDLVELVARVDPGERESCVRATAVEILTPYRAEEPFPSPGSEYYRLHAPVSAGGDHRAGLLVLRARCLAAIRAFFDGQGFTEVQTPLVVHAPGLEPHLVARQAGGGFLITSPEYQMKRLLAAGLERIYFLGPCWRGDEEGSHHLGEFCMLEWYQAYCSLERLMEQTEALLGYVARQVRGTTKLVYQGQAVSLSPPFRRLTFARACAELAGVDVHGVVETGELRRRAEAAGLGPFSPEEPFEAVASRVVVERVEPGLGPGPVFLHAFPAPLAALARLQPDDPTVAERFELYAGGLELANAFGELTDPVEQRRRLEQDQAARRRAGAPVHPIDERFLGALEQGIPPAAGIALGVDRLVMLLGDAADIRQVVAFAPDEI
jgi:lysyl-tRNA synthetase class 2